MPLKSKIFCNACGREYETVLPGMGKDYKVCSVDCLRDMQWRYYASLLNKEYVPFSQKFDENGNPIKNG